MEWKGEKPPKQKYRIGLKNQSQFCLAGLWEKWERGEKSLESFTIITTAANDLVAEIHSKKRMPVIIDADNYDRWLHDTTNASDLLRPYPSRAMEAFEVDKIVSSSHEGDPGLFPPESWRYSCR